MGEAASSAAITVLFVDLVRFTSLTDVHGDQAAADVAGALEAVAESHLVDGARIVKTLGDGILLTAPSPAVGLSLAGRVLEGLHDLGIGADARFGAAHGPVIERQTDVFGSTVNLAARAASLAQPGHIVVTRPLAEVVGDLILAATPMGEGIVSGFVEEIELFEIDLCEHAGEWLSDPVCGMRLPVEDAVERHVHDDHLVGFCSTECVDIFHRTPHRFTSAGARRLIEPAIGPIVREVSRSQ